MGTLTQSRVDEDRARDELIRAAVAFLKDADATLKHPERVRLAQRILEADERRVDALDGLAADLTAERDGQITPEEAEARYEGFDAAMAEANAEIDGAARELAGIAEEA